MLISQKMNGAINEQIGYEFSASLQYVAIASFFVSEGLNQLAQHFFRQSEEERDHAMRFVKYLLDAGGKVAIPSVPAPRVDFGSAADAVQHSLEQEKMVTDRINRLVQLAIQESDHITQNALTWFVNEQLEEVSSFDHLLKVVKRAGESNLLYVEDYIARGGEKTRQSGEKS